MWQSVADGPVPADLNARLQARVKAQADRPSELKRKSHFWTRFVHVYLSLFSFFLVLFFGITGITLNHPSWTFGDEVTVETITGTLPDDVVVDGAIEFLMVSEFLRANADVAGEVTDFSTTDGEGTISYRGPGYGADVFFDTTTLDYSLSVQQQGFVAVMNDLHKGRDTTSMWRWVIDISAGFLVLVALTGIGLQLFMRKRRISGLTWAAAGTLVGIVVIWLTMV